MTRFVSRSTGEPSRRRSRGPIGGRRGAAARAPGRADSGPVATMVAATLCAATFPAHSDEPPRLPAVEVIGRYENEVGVWDSASQGAVTGDTIRKQPLLRPGEVLEAVPGLVLTQHSGGGKANQFFLRGFNLDHGTDFAHRRRHAGEHADPRPRPGLRRPELPDPRARRRHRLPQGSVRRRPGRFRQRRRGRARLRHPSRGRLRQRRRRRARLPAPARRRRLRARCRRRRRRASSSPRATGRGRTRTTSARETRSCAGRRHRRRRRLAAPPRPATPRSGTRPTRCRRAPSPTAGSTASARRRHRRRRARRSSLVVDRARATSGGLARATAWALYSDLDLFSNFTYFLADPVNGDQFEQVDERWALGGSASGAARRARAAATSSGRSAPTCAATGSRTACSRLAARAARHHPPRRRRAPGRRGRTPRRRVDWGEWFRSVLGYRVDLYRVHVTSDLTANSGDESHALGSPKLGLVFLGGAGATTELYLNAGYGFHPNDARGATLARRSHDRRAGGAGGPAGAPARRRPRGARRVAAGARDDGLAVRSRHRLRARLRRRRGDDRRRPAEPSVPESSWRTSGVSVADWRSRPTSRSPAPASATTIRRATGSRARSSASLRSRPTSTGSAAFGRRPAALLRPARSRRGRQRALGGDDPRPRPRSATRSRRDGGSRSRG